MATAVPKSVEEVQDLEREVSGSVLKVNGLVRLVGGLGAECSSEVKIKCSLALVRVFKKLAKQGFLVLKEDDESGNTQSEGTYSVKSASELKKKNKRKRTETPSSGSARKVRVWVRERFSEAVEALGELLTSAEDGREQAAGFHAGVQLAILKDTETGRLRQNGVLLTTICSILENALISDTLTSHMDQKFLVCFDGAECTAKILRSALTGPEISEKVQSNSFRILLALSRKFRQGDISEDMMLVDEKSDPAQKRQKTLNPFFAASDKLAKTNKLKHLISHAWMAFFRHKLTTSDYKGVLETMKDDILPVMQDPLLLFDFLKESYDVGGIVSLLALEGLFTLMQKHNLDYPDFYGKLYKLLTPQNLQSRHRSRFFSLVQLFLKSFKLPSYIIAAFMKRLLRISLKADPGVCIFALALCFNLIKRHSSCEVLVKRVPKDAGALAFLSLKPFGQDPYDPQETDLSKCGAMDSCLWEIRALGNHYSSKVVGLVRNFTDENPPKFEIDIKEYISETYSTLYEEEAKFRKNQKVPLRYEPPKSFRGMIA
ncbi:hypothetical protein AAMO2058_001026400 [Amorphochlora amoebiformis]